MHSSLPVCALWTSSLGAQRLPFFYVTLLRLVSKSEFLVILEVDQTVAIGFGIIIFFARIV